ncbi:hypothetical protein KUTeg_011900 [Tegillarca granosa]|uniref:Carboxylesterase type B domain-containing protein n=1 Tax=Tegillarca granosa TaxID=220873 RepID=A0ABQ9F365_TEGGR|nr:hypothetical protein KUTeg_011900 [Tegillarca granosa]
MSTDIFFFGPTVKTLKVDEDKNTERKTYHYFFTRAIPEMLGGIAPWLAKVGHAAELIFLFGGIVFNVNLTTEESLLGDRIIECWSNFAKTGVYRIQYQSNGYNSVTGFIPGWLDISLDKVKCEIISAFRCCAYISQEFYYRGSSSM